MKDTTIFQTCNDLSGVVFSMGVRLSMDLPNEGGLALGAVDLRMWGMWGFQTPSIDGANL